MNLQDDAFLILLLRARWLEIGWAVLYLKMPIVWFSLPGKFLSFSLTVVILFVPMLFPAVTYELGKC